MVLGSIIGAFTGNSERESQNKYAKKQAKEQNKYNKSVYRFERSEIKRRNQYAKDELAITKRNYADNRAFGIESDNRNWQRQQYLQDFQYQTAKEAYEKSEENYGKSLSFNNLAAAYAYNGIQVGLDAVKREQAFQKQDFNIESLQAEGKAQLGQSGNSTQKVLNSITAAKGRQLASLEASLETKYDAVDTEMRDVAMRKLGADFQADARRRQAPRLMDDIPKPLLPPERQFQEPYELKQGPEPPKTSAYQAPSSLGMDLLGAGLNMATGFVSGGLAAGGGFNLGNAFGGSIGLMPASVPSGFSLFGGS